MGKCLSTVSSRDSFELSMILPGIFRKPYLLFIPILSINSGPGPPSVISVNYRPSLREQNLKQAAALDFQW